jgi:hypothetical protein
LIASDLAALLRFGDEMVGAQRRLDQVEVAADDGVVVDMGHGVERVLDLGLEVLGGDLAFGACAGSKRATNSWCRPRAISG